MKKIFTLAWGAHISNSKKKFTLVKGFPVRDFEYSCIRTECKEYLWLMSNSYDITMSCDHHSIFKAATNRIYRAIFISLYLKEFCPTVL